MYIFIVCSSIYLITVISIRDCLKKGCSLRMVRSRWEIVCFPLFLNN